MLSVFILIISQAMITYFILIIILSNTTFRKHDLLFSGYLIIELNVIYIFFYLFTVVVLNDVLLLYYKMYKHLMYLYVQYIFDC